MKKKCYYNIYKHLKILSQFGVFSLLLLLSFLFTNSVKAEETLFFDNGIIGIQSNNFPVDYASQFNSDINENVVKINTHINEYNYSSGGDVHLEIKKVSDCSLIGITETLTISSSGQWVSFNFANGGLELEPNTDYQVSFVLESGNFRMSGSVGYGYDYRRSAYDCSNPQRYMGMAMQIYTNPDWTPTPERLNVYSDIVVAENGKNNGWPIPIYYNYCDKYADLENVYLEFCEDWDGDICYSENNEFIILKGTYNLNPCERFMYYRSDVYEYPDNYFNENGIYEFDGIMRLTLDYTAESGLQDEYIDSETFTARVYQPNTNYDPRNYIESGVSSPLILPITATSTDINFIYDLSSYEWNATSSEVCLYNIESSTIADSFCTTLSQANGTGTITLTGNGTNYEDTFGFVYLEEGIKKLYSDDAFFVQWGEGLAYYDKFEDYNIEALSGLSTHDIACSAEEWAEADEDGVFNFTRLKCRSIKTGLDIANSITSMFRKSIELLKNQVIGNAFPLNIPFKISQSWKQSEHENLPTELNYLDSGENGNLKISMPEEWTGTTSTEMTLWGSEIFNETEETTNKVFNFIRALSKYTIWLLVIIYLLNLAISAFEEFMPRKQTAELQDINIDNRGRISSHYHIFDD